MCYWYMYYKLVNVGQFGHDCKSQDKTPFLVSRILFKGFNKRLKHVRVTNQRINCSFKDNEVEE